MAVRCLQPIASTSTSHGEELVLAVSEHAILWRLGVSNRRYDGVDEYNAERSRIFPSAALRNDADCPPPLPLVPFAIFTLTYEYFITPLADLTSSPTRHATCVLSAFAPNKPTAAFATATRLFAVEDFVDNSTIRFHQAVSSSPLFDGDVECFPCSDRLSLGGRCTHYAMVFLNEDQSSSDGVHYYVFLVSGYYLKVGKYHVIKRFRIRRDGRGWVEEVDCVFCSETTPLEDMRRIVAETRRMKSFMEGQDLVYLDDEDGTWQRRRVDVPRHLRYRITGLIGLWDLFEPLAIFGHRWRRSRQTDGTCIERILWVSPTGQLADVFLWPSSMNVATVARSRKPAMDECSSRLAGERVLMACGRGALPTLLEAARGACCALLTERKLLDLQQEEAFDFRSFVTFVNNDD